MDQEHSYPLQSILDAKVEIQIVLLQQMIALRNISSLKEGSVLTFNVSRSSPASLSLNGQKFARGQVVQVNENYGLKITEIEH